MMLRCRSHRAREKLHRLVGRDNCKAYWRTDWQKGEYIEIPDEFTEGAVTIKGITRARINRDILALCW